MKFRFLSIFAAISFFAVAASAQTITFGLDVPFQVRYASNLAIGDSVVNITNTGALSTIVPAGGPFPVPGPSGATATSPFPIQNGNICANVYVFSPDEQLISCCACPITPDGLVSLSARNDLISNTLTPGVPTSIVIKIVSSEGIYTGSGNTTPQTFSCNAATVSTPPPTQPPPPAPPVTLGVNAPSTNFVTGTNTNIFPSGAMAAWGTTIHALPVTPGSPATTYGVTETAFTPATLSAAELTRITTLCGFIGSNGSGFGVCRSCRLGGLGAGNSAQ